MKLIHVVLKAIYKDAAVVFNPVTLTDVQRASFEIVKNKGIKIPNDYAAFLTEVDGLSWNGLYLFSLNEKERQDGAFIHPGILQTYHKGLKNPIFKNRLLLGYGPEEIITYHAGKKEYQILSQYDYRILVRLPRFFDVLYYYTHTLFEDTNSN